MSVTGRRDNNSLHLDVAVRYDDIEHNIGGRRGGGGGDPHEHERSAHNAAAEERIRSRRPIFGPVVERREPVAVP
jgi:hypothetical protein